MVATRSAMKAADGRRQEEAEEKGGVWHKGVAISMWQNSGDEDSNWTEFINSRFPFKWLPFGMNRYSGRWNVNERSPDTWNRWGGPGVGLPRPPSLWTAAAAGLDQNSCSSPTTES
jgi:hypothetical protein